MVLDKSGSDIVNTIVTSNLGELSIAIVIAIIATVIYACTKLNSQSQKGNGEV